MSPVFIQTRAFFPSVHLDSQGQGRVASASTSVYGLEDINKLQALLSDEMLQEVK